MCAFAESHPSSLALTMRRRPEVRLEARPGSCPPCRCVSTPALPAHRRTPRWALVAREASPWADCTVALFVDLARKCV